MLISVLSQTPHYKIIYALNFTFRELEAGSLNACRIHGTPPPGLGVNLGEDLGNELGAGSLEDALCKDDLHSWHHCPEVHKAIDGVRFIADHTRREEDSTRVCMNTNIWLTLYCVAGANYRKP